MKILTKSFFDLFINKKFSFSILLICLLLSFAACGSDGSDSGRDEVITITIPGINNVKLTMHWIPEGTFQMGSPTTETNHQPKETLHTVTLTKGFYMGIYEVTQEQYEAVMGENPSYLHGGHGREPATGEEQGKRPAEQVNWYDAIVFCNRLSILEGLDPVYRIPGFSNSTDPDVWGAVPSSSDGTWNAAVMIGWPDKVPNGYRLPTEAEWEYACRAGTDTAWSFGSSFVDIDLYAWYYPNSGSKTHEVGKKKPNDFGLYDMHGNVHEWCWDWYGGAYESGPQTAPKGDFSGSYRVMRGGGWSSDDAGDLRSAARSADYPNNSSSSVIGLRVVRP